jgi:hypothetical protein
MASASNQGARNRGEGSALNLHKKNHPAGEAGMRPYFFDVSSYGEHHDARGGKLMPDDGAALDHAMGIISELRNSGGYDDPALTMVVRNAAGKTIFAIPFLEIERAV